MQSGHVSLQQQHHQHPAGVAAATGSDAATGQQQQQPATSFVSLVELKELCSKALSTIGYSKDEIAVLLEVCVGF
jgi:hypothetical protein